jgi:hypothetical protein
MSETAKEIKNLLLSVKRAGIPELVKWLIDDTDFFTSPASTKYHGNYIGGLADHSLNAFDSLTLLNSEFRDKDSAYPDETITIVALLHDLCKVNTYIEDAEHATEPQMKFLKDLLSKSSEQISMPPDHHLTKGFITKLIDYLKNGGEEVPVYSPVWKVDDQLPMGHGEKSIYMIQKFMDLTDEEALAIRWHLGAHDPGAHFFYPTGVANNQAVREVPLVSMMAAADYIATWLIDLKK